jgi:hypothetical protein
MRLAYVWDFCMCGVWGFRMCGTTASLGTGHTMSMCILAHDGVHWLQHGWRPLPACVCMAYVYVRVLAWYNVHCA